MGFRGWASEAVAFYERLEADNTRSFWQAHKAEYELVVRRPMEELLAELGSEFGEGKIYRPNRDTRFSADKTPYKTAIAATLAGGGYIQFSADGLGCGSGMWMMAPDQLERFRDAVDNDRTGKALEKLVATAKAAGLDVSGHEMLKTAPRGYPKDHPRIELLRAKGFVTWKSWPVGAWLGSRKAKDRVVDFLRTSRPVHEWLQKTVGPSTLPEDGRGRR